MWESGGVRVGRLGGVWEGEGWGKRSTFLTLVPFISGTDIKVSLFDQVTFKMKQKAGIRPSSTPPE